MTERRREVVLTLVVTAVPLALVGLVLVALGHDPVAVLRALLRGSVATEAGLTATLKQAVPLLLCGLAVTVGFRAGVFNLGAEGQLVLGAIAATAVGVKLGASLPWPLGAVAALGAGALAGAGWAAVAGWLKRARGAPEVLATILLNFVAIRLAAFLVDYGNPLNEEAAAYLESDRLAPGACLEPFARGDLEVRAGLVLAVVLAALLDHLLLGTRAGLELRLTGTAPGVARATGFSPARAASRAFWIGGALAGLAGALSIVEVSQRLYGAKVAEGAGYTAVAVALLGRLRPLGVVAAALGFAALEAGAQGAERQAHVPHALAGAVEGLLVLAFLVQRALGERLAARASTRAAQARASAGRGPSTPASGPPEPTGASA